MKRKIVIVFLLVFLLLSPLLTITSRAAAPTVTTNDATGIDTYNATLQGILNNDGGIANITAENYTTGEDSGMSRYGNYWAAQTFTPTYDYPITKVALALLSSTGVSTTITVSIRATDGSGHPTGADLTSGTVSSSGLPVALPAEYRNITLNPYMLYSGVKYAIVFRNSFSSPNFIIWRADADVPTPPTYAGGNQEYSSNAGSTWSTGSYDFMFRTYTGTIARFEYGTTVSYGTNTENQTKTTGQTVSQNIFGPSVSFTAGKLYHFRIRATNKDGTANGADKTFVSKPTVPAYVTKTSYLTAIKLTWMKGVGANRTLIRYSDSSYPLTVADGILGYNNTGTTLNVTSLTPGKTYYFSLWSFTIWGALSQYSSVVNVYATTSGSSNFTFNFPQYLEVGDYILASGTIVNITGIPINNIWCHTIIYNQTGINVTGSYRAFWVVNGYYSYTLSSSAMKPGVYFIRLNYTQAGINYNTTNILYLSQPGGAGHARAMVYFTYYNTNQGIGLPTETLQLFVNDTRIYTHPLSYESYTGARINVKVKDYYNFTMFQWNYTVNRTVMPINLGLTFHSWLFGNWNNKAYMVSLLKAGATRWWERGIVPYGEVEYLIPSGTYQMRIYDSLYKELINQSFAIANSRVYVINGTNLTLLINGQSIIIGQLLEDLDYALTPDVIIRGTNPPLVYSVYDVDGMCIGNGIYKICPAVVTIATTRTTQNGNWVNSSPRIPTNGSVTNGTITILRDELYIAGNSTITWVNIRYTNNGTLMQNTTYIPSKIQLYGQNITINASENIEVKRETKYNQVKKFYWTYYSYEGRYTAGINITNPMPVPIYDVYVYVEFANDSNPDFSSVTMRDVANNGTIMKRGENFDVSAGGVHFYLLSINSSSSRTFTIDYRKGRSELYSYGVAEYTVSGYEETVYQGNTYHYFYINWVNTGSLIFRGIINTKLNFNNVLNIDPNSIVLKDNDNNRVLSSDGFTQAGNMLTLGSSVLGDVKPGGGRSFTVYFIFEEYPGADPEVYTLGTPLFIFLGFSITLLLVGLLVFSLVLVVSVVLLVLNKKSKKMQTYKLGAGLSLLAIMLLLIFQASGL